MDRGFEGDGAREDTAAGAKASAAHFLMRLRHLRASHVVGLPDNASAALLAGIPRVATARRVAPGVPGLVAVTREGEAFAVASGLWLGGARPVVVVQSTGLLESGDALRGTALRMGVPLPIVVTCRGWQKAVAAGLDPLVGADALEGPEGRDLLTREDVDSAALLIVPTLRAWGIPFHVYRPDDAMASLDACWNDAWMRERPVALLVTGALE